MQLLLSRWKEASVARCWKRCVASRFRSVVKLGPMPRPHRSSSFFLFVHACQFTKPPVAPACVSPREHCNACIRKIKGCSGTRPRPRPWPRPEADRRGNTRGIGRYGRVTRRARCCRKQTHNPCTTAIHLSVVGQVYTEPVANASLPGILALRAGPEPFEHEEPTEPYLALSCCIKARREAPLDKTRRVKSFE